MVQAEGKGRGEETKGATFMAFLHHHDHMLHIFNMHAWTTPPHTQRNDGFVEVSADVAVTAVDRRCC